MSFKHINAAAGAPDKAETALAAGEKNGVRVSSNNYFMAIFLATFYAGFLVYLEYDWAAAIILLAAWAGQKQTASISALFIFVNSVAGLLGQLLLHKASIECSANMGLMIATGVAGSLAGAWLGAKKLNIAAIKYVLSFVLLIAAYHLIWK